MSFHSEDLWRPRGYWVDSRNTKMIIYLIWIPFLSLQRFKSVQIRTFRGILRIKPLIWGSDFWDCLLRFSTGRGEYWHLHPRTPICAGVQQQILCVSLGRAHQSVSDLVPEKTRGVLGRLWGSSACAAQKITGVEPRTAAFADLMSDRREWKGVKYTGGPTITSRRNRRMETRSAEEEEGWCDSDWLFSPPPTWALRALSADATCLSSHPSL